MTVVRSTLNLAPGATVSAVLSGPSGFKLDHSEQVTGYKVVAGTDGSWSLDLPAQSTFRYPGSVWVIRHNWATHYVVVPDSGPVYVDDIEVTNPGSGTAPTPSVYLTRAERGALNGVASLDGTGKVPLSQLPPSGGGGVSTVTATDATITIGGTGTDPTVGVNTIPESKVTGLVSDLALKAPQTAVDSLTTTVAGKGVKLVVKPRTVTSGNVTLPDTSGVWAPLSGFEITIPAVSGDWVELSMNAMRSNSSSAFIARAVRVEGTIVRYLSNGTGTPPIEGDPEFYYDPTFPHISSKIGFQVTPGDLDTGLVRFIVATKGAGGGTLYASDNFPFNWAAYNHGPCTVL